MKECWAAGSQDRWDANKLKVTWKQIALGTAGARVLHRARASTAVNTSWCVFGGACVRARPTKGGWFKGWQEARAEIKSLNCYIFHLHLLFYGGWGPPSDTGGDSWTFGRPVSSAIPHRRPAACAPKAPTQLPWWIWLVFLLVFLLILSPPPPTSRFLRVTVGAKCSCWAVRNKQFAISGSSPSAPRRSTPRPPESWTRWERRGATDAWREGGGDPDKGEIREINTSDGDEGRARRWHKEMRDQNWQGESADGAYAEGTERYRK